MNDQSDERKLLLEIDESNDGFDFYTSIDEAMEQADLKIEELNESIESIQLIKSEADKVDYMLAVGMGSISGIIDIFLVGKTKNNPVGEITEQWFEERIKDFAKIMSWMDEKEDSLSSAIEYLEEAFNITIDKSILKDFKESISGLLTPNDGNFDSMKDDLSLLGLFYTILNQFKNTSDSISEDELITLSNVGDKFELHGHNVSGKLYSGFVNWFSQLISDVSDSSLSKSQGMGIPSPLWTWINSLASIRENLNIPTSQFDEYLAKIALTIYQRAYKTPFQAKQVIPVFVNEILVRFIYSIRRMIHYFLTLECEYFSFEEVWESAEPFTNPTVKRMLTVAHGTFCLVDLRDATLHGYRKGVSMLNPAELLLRLNIVGVGRFTISLYGEGKRAINFQQTKNEYSVLSREKVIVEDYLEGLKILADSYDDVEIIQFIRDFKSSDLYIEVFEKSVTLAQKRKVSEEKILKNKTEIDAYFRGGE